MSTLNSVFKLIKKASKRLIDERKRPSAIFDIGKKDLPINSKKALVIYSIEALQFFLKGKLDQFPNITHHSRYWESAEIARLLNKHGYIVDYFHSKGYPTIDWKKYDLVIDCLNNLKDDPIVTGQVRVYYASSNHWLSWNFAELQRTLMFKERTGIVVPTNRQIPPIASDEYADYLTYFGTKLQTDSFNKKPEKVLINISSVFIPKFQKKNIALARKNFLWLGGGGMLHKGMDLILEAFAKIPDKHLYVTGDLEDQPEFWGWAKNLIAKHSNIHYLGYVDVATPSFEKIANDCIGVVYASAAEGGPGSIAQAIHFGLIPIVTPSSFVRAEILGYAINGSNDKDIIQSTIDQVTLVSNLHENELREKSNAVREFAQRYHTRSAYTESFDLFLETIDKKYFL